MENKQITWIALGIQTIVTISVFWGFSLKQENRMATMEERIEQLIRLHNIHVEDPTIHHQGIGRLEENYRIDDVTLAQILTEVNNIKEDVSEIKIDVSDLQKRKR